MRITHYTKNYVFAFLSVFALLLTNYTIQGQTTLISPTGDGGFENGSTFAANGWSESSGANNPWVIGTAVSTAPISGNSAYISNDGGISNAYTPANNATNFFWRDVTVPSGETKITLSFNWSQQAENSWDIWQVFYAPTSVNPVGSTTHPGSGTSNVPAAISGATYIGNGAVATGVQTATYNLPASLAGTTFRLIFSWKNETGGVQPPAAIDNISLVSDVPGDFISAMTGDWNVGATWMGGVAPTAGDNATITAGHVVTINASSLAITNLTIDGTLAYGATPASFAVNGNLTVNSGGVFNVFQSTTGKTLSVAGNITNNGTIDISVGTTTAGNLTLNGATVQTISGTGSFNTNVIRNLTCSNTNTSTPNIIWNVNNVKIANNLNLTGARIELMGNKITHGNGAAVGTLTAPAGTGFLPGGKYARWWTNAQTGTTITAGSDPANTAGTALSRYPFLSATGQNRAMYISRSSSTATGNTAGELAVVYTDAATMTTGLSITDGAYTITDRYNGNWTVTAEAGYVYVSGTHLVALQATNAYFPANGNSRVMNAAGVVGTHQNGTITPGAQRTGLTTAQLTAEALYMGINEADIPFLSVASGDWNDPTKWNKGTVPVCTDIVTILNGHTITVNSAANVSRNVTINAGGTLVVASGDLTVGCTLNNNTLTNNGTLTVQGGILNINGNMLHNAGSTFNQSGGDINVDGNANGNAANSVASGVSIVQLNSQNINWNGGMLTIVDPHANTTASNSFAYTNSTAHVNVTAGHTIRFGDGSSTDPGGNATNGFRLTTWVGSNRISFFNVIINGGSGTNRYITSQYSFGINGNLTINNDSEYRPGTTTYVNGNVTNNGTATLTSTLFLASFLSGTESASSNAQSISGSGIFRNLVASPTANLTSLSVNNTNATGVTLNVPLSVSGTLTLTSGFVNTTSTNILQLGTALAAGTLVGGSATAYVNGPFARTFPANRTAAGTYTVATLYPVGKTASSAYLPIHVDPTTNAGGPVIISSEAFTTNSGTGASGVTGLSSNRWEALITSGASNFTSTNLRLNDAAIVSSNKILQASSAAGTYGSIVPVSTFAAGTPNTLTTTSTQILAAAYDGYFAYGNLEDCVVPADQPTAFVESNLGTTTMTGSFTAATSNPSHYLVVRYLAGDSPTHPSDFTAYTVGQALGLGTVRSVSGSTTFNDSGLTANTQYDYYVYSYNNVGCNGPVYNITSPLIGNIKTCDAVTGTPGTPTASAVTSSSFTATWTASSTPGVDYIIEVATDAAFTSLVSGYNPLNVGMILSTPVTGLAANTTHYVRVRAELAGCFSVVSGTLTVITNCSAVTPPRMEGFEDNSNGLDCWRTGLVSGTTNWGIQNGSSSDISAAYSGTRFAVKSWNTSNAILYSLPLDYSSVTSPTRLNVYLHRHASAHVNDEYKIHVNTSATLTGATEILSLFSRTTTAPTVPSTGWYNYLIDIPVSFHGEAVVYIIFQGITTAGFSSYDLGVDDFKIEFIPQDAVDYGNLQWVSRSTMQPCETVDVYAQAWKDGVTNSPGQGAGLIAWIGRNSSDTDPSTWPESAWTIAPYFGEVGNNDEYKLSYTDLPLGTHYIASRFQLNGGPFRYGADNNGFWNGMANNNWVLNVTMPAFTPTGSPMTICNGQSTDIDVTTAFNDYSFQWNPGMLSGKMHTVNPTNTTTYIVTVTDINTTCTASGSITITVNPLPAISGATADPNNFCSGGNSQLEVITSSSAKDYLFSTGTGVGLVDMSGATTIVNNSVDDTPSTLQTIGFNFTFDNATFTDYSVSPDGFLKLGSPAASSQFTNSITSITNIPKLYPYWDDMATGSDGSVQALLTGTAPNRILVVQWFVTIPRNTIGPANSTFQALLYETSNVVEFRYGTMNSASMTSSVGLSGVTPGSNFNCVTISSNTNSTTVANNNNSDQPASGRYYTFTPPSYTYAWSPATFLSAINISNPMANAVTTTTAYTAQVTDQNNCSNTMIVSVNVEGTVVKNSGNAGFNTLRGVYDCITEGGIITYDQPTTDESILTVPLDITKSVTIQGLNDMNRPEITIPAAGMNIATGKTLTLENVDVKYTGSGTFTGSGTVEIIGTTVGKE